MTEAEKLIEALTNASETDLMEFDFEPVYELLRERDRAVDEIATFADQGIRVLNLLDMVERLRNAVTYVVSKPEVRQQLPNDIRESFEGLLSADIPS